MINTSHGKSVGKYHMVIRVKTVPPGLVLTRDNCTKVISSEYHKVWGGKQQKYGLLDVYWADIKGFLIRQFFHRGAANLRGFSW